MRLNKHIVAAFAMTTLVSLAMVAPASVATATDAESGFSVTLELKQDQGARHLEWHSENCEPKLGGPAKVTYTLEKDGTPVTINNDQLALNPGDTGDYTLTGTCNPSPWYHDYQYITKNVTVHVDAAQPGGGSTPPGAATPPEGDNGPFTLNFSKEGDGDAAKLTWSVTGCEAPNRLEKSLTRDGEAVDIVGVNELALSGQPAGTYEFTAKCSPEWLAPTTLKKTVTVAASSAGTTDPAQPGAGAGQPGTPAQPGNTDMRIVSAAFSESPANRTLSWDVRGCSVLNTKSVAVEVWFNGHQAQVQRASRKEENVNASQWPTGPYKIVAKCKSLADGSVLQTLEQDLELTRANLPNVFAWDRPLNYLIPRPGDRLHISSYPTHNALVLKDGTQAEPFLPNEEVKISYLFDDTEPAIEGPTLQADANGHVETNIWIPLKDGVKNFQILAVGQQSKRQLDYKSVLAPTSGYGIDVAEVANQPLSLRVTSHKPDDMNTETVVEKNREITIEIVGPDDTIVKTIQVTTNEDGTLDTTIDLPEPVAEGRYTVLVPTILHARGHYAAHFYAKDGRLWPQWEEPKSKKETAIPSENVPVVILPEGHIPPVEQSVAPHTPNPADPGSGDTLTGGAGTGSGVGYATTGHTETQGDSLKVTTDDTATNATNPAVESGQVDDSVHLAKTGVNTAHLLAMVVLLSAAGFTMIRIRRS